MQEMVTPGERPGLAVVYRSVNALRSYERNARTHSPEQIDQIAASIREFGFNVPILLRDDEQTIGAGHGRWEAALQVGLAQVPTITLHGLTDAQWRAFIIADNQLALNAGWDHNMLRSEIERLAKEGFNLDLLGFANGALPDLEPPTFDPIDPSDLKRLDERAKTTCPSCGHEF